MLVELPDELSRARIPQLDHPVQPARDEREGCHVQPPHRAFMPLLTGDEFQPPNVPLVDGAGRVAREEHAAFGG